MGCGFVTIYSNELRAEIVILNCLAAFTFNLYVYWFWFSIDFHSLLRYPPCIKEELAFLVNLKWETAHGKVNMDMPQEVPIILQAMEAIRYVN